MATAINARLLRTLALLGLGALLASALTGCGGSGTSGGAIDTASQTVAAARVDTATATALSFAKKAAAIVTEQTPGAVLFGVQTPAPTMDLPPVKWDYLFGDPKRNKIIAIEMSPDATGTPADAGNSKVAASEYANVAKLDEWKVDSVAALNAASDLYKATYKSDPPGPVSMGLVLIRPAKTKAVGAKALQWEVYFFPANGDTDKSVRISVDAVTGKAFLAATAKT